MINNLGKLIILCILLTFIFSIGNKVEANNQGVVTTNTTEGNNLFTSKLQLNNGYCTAVALSEKTFLTAGHCVGFESKNESLGYVYPDNSGILDPLSYMEVTESINYDNNNKAGGKDLALVKGTSPSTSMLYYLKDKSPKIKTIDNIEEYIGREVYTIGYPLNKGEKYQVRYDGQIVAEYHDTIGTDISPSKGGRSGGGLYLKDTDELIGILSFNTQSTTTYFAPITTEVNEWINKHK